VSEQGTWASSQVTVAGLGIGVLVGVRRRSMWPAMIGGAVGSAGDYVYGLGWACKSQVEVSRASVV
jgi:uncharacterized membrane protein YjjB (DUF3815 family)